ncbi:hypothetical protein JCM11491_007195 [Sporobolomyces phaffii]
MNLKPLHHLYQTISPACLLDDEEPLVAVSRLERRGKAPSGEIEWVVGVAAQGGRDAPVWWSTRLGAHGIEQLAKQASVADSLFRGIERDKLAIDKSFLREEVKELKKSWRDAAASGQTTKRACSEGPSESSQPGGTSRPSQRATSGSLSPQKRGRPGIDYKAVMRPGTKGYAGSANRVGRDLGDEWEEPDSDSD